ncbi:Hypothetical predicted protein [Octopus vulgaris]|uniref:Uncharacterized protein n=1 Tax=Octopus vulgaris TaxID=6645 RepID=A0AA36AP03_OCTVU|nr:Hypothetical predicted protein [Octopus vulgaris]
MDLTDYHQRPLSVSILMLTFSFVLPSGLGKRCYVCYSGEQQTSKSYCPPQSITAPYLTNSEACYGSCFVRVKKQNPNVIFRGCTDLHPDLPPHLPLKSCRSYSNEQWCFCDTNLCNRASMDELRNPPTEEEEEIIPKRTEESKVLPFPTNKANEPTERNNYITRTTHLVKPQWFLKRVPSQLKDHKNLSGGPEAYLNIPISNSSSSTFVVNKIAWESERTTRGINGSESYTESMSRQCLPSLLLVSVTLMVSLCVRLQLFKNY